MNTHAKYIALGVLFTLCTITVFSQEKMIFPRAFAFAVDDLGWNIGNDTGDLDNQGPYRIGLNKKMHLDDYKPLVEVGKKVGTRIQSLFVLSEMDRLNILKKYPTTTWQGADWDNSKNISNEQIDIMNYVKENAAYMEFGLHGVGHEYWVDGKKVRAEWYNLEDNKPWKEEIMKTHLQCFNDIMAQYGLSKENGNSFPESFVPCAYGYYWNPNGDYSTGKIMLDAGVKYVNTLFDEIRELNPPKETNGGGFDHGVLVINRINYGNEWYQLSALPTEPIEEQETDIIETHWSNWLAQDAFLQEEVNSKFIAYYNMVQATPNRYVAKNTEQLYAQWLYNKYTVVTENQQGIVSIDNTKMPNKAYQNNILGTMVLKIKLNPKEHIYKATLNSDKLGVYYEDAGYGFLYLPRLAQKKYTLTYELGKKPMSKAIYLKGTYNVYSFKSDKNTIKAKIRVYGTQDIIFKGIKKAHQITSSNKNIHILKETYNSKNKTLIVTVKALDIQGETGTFTIH
jgi:hypothetical protein